MARANRRVIVMSDEPKNNASEHDASSLDSYDGVRDRLQEISEQINDDMPLDQALDLLEEAVGLGVKASSLIETNIEDHIDAENEADTGTDDAAHASQTSNTDSNAGASAPKHGTSPDAHNSTESTSVGTD